MVSPYAVTRLREIPPPRNIPDQTNPTPHGEHTHTHTQEVYANPEYKVKLSQSRRRDPEHNRKISEAIRKKWAEEGYKNKTLSGIQSYQSQYQEAA